MSHSVPATPAEATRGGWEIVDCPVTPEHVAARAPDSDRVYCWIEERWVGDPLDTLRSLDKDDPLVHEQAANALRELKVNLNGKDKLDRESAREAAIAALKAKVSSPARFVDAALGPSESEPGSNKQGQAVVSEDPDPWLEHVDGEELLSELAEIIARFVVLPARAAVAVALWVLFTYVHDAFSVSPILAMVSPEKRCGKTTLLSLLLGLVRRPTTVSNITAAALFRFVESFQPCLLIDEADTFVRHNDDLRGILNSGHSRAAAFVIRTSGDDYEPRKFSTWSPKAIALIGTLPNTLMDRSVVVRMKRKGRGEDVEQLRLDRLSEFEPLQQRCLRWANDNRDALNVSDPTVPAELNDRAADNWRPLLAVAEIAGGEWPERAREAAWRLSGGEDGDESVGTQLLTDIHSAFSESGERIFTDELLEHLHGLEERPWPEWGRTGKPMSAVQLARKLKPFGVKPRQVKIEGESRKGYRAEDFEDTFRRYLSPVQGETPKPCNGGGPDRGIQGETPPAEVSGRDIERGNSDGQGFGVSPQGSEWGEL